MDLVVSLRQGDESASLLVDLVEEAEAPFWEALEKKPKMLLCCLPAVDADDMVFVFLAAAGVFGWDMSPILEVLSVFEILILRNMSE